MSSEPVFAAESPLDHPLADSDDAPADSGVRRTSPELVPGAVVAGRYELDREIGEGGMARVWAAHDRVLDCRCAVKFLRSGFGVSSEVRARFEREAALVARVRSTNVVSIIDRGEWQGQPFIAMEYLDGENLAERLARQGRLDAGQAYEIVAQLASGLGLVHARGIVHRDVKPENVCLVPGEPSPIGETAKLLDFGIAEQVFPAPDAATTQTQTGLFVGTAHYASPEQLRGAHIDWRSDLWSLGVLAFECLTGMRPFEGRSLGDLCGAVLYEPVPRVTQLDAELPAELDAWFERALARDPARRFQSAREMADSLALTLAYARTTIQSPAPLVALERDADDLLEPVSSPEDKHTSRRWWRLPWMTLLLVLVAFAGGVRVARTRFWEGLAADASRATASALASYLSRPTAGAE